MSDSDPYVRRMAVSWLRSPSITSRKREAWFERAMRDPDASVRASTVASKREWDARDRAWPIELWRLWQDGERGQVGMKFLIVITVAAPIVIGFAFLLYYIARLLTHIARRQWRAAAVVPVIAIWGAASYGLFLVYFMAGHTGDLDAGEVAVVASILWGAVAVYAAVGWILHYLVRRN